MARKSVGSPRVATVLSLPESHWKQFYDVYRPGRSDAQIDHVLVGPSGAYVIQYRDLVETSLEAAATEPAESADAVGSLLPPRYRSRVKPVLCFREAEPVADLVGGVLVTSSMALEHILRSSPVVFSTCEVAELFSCLNSRLVQVPAVPARPRTWWALGRRVAALPVFSKSRSRRAPADQPST